MIIEGIVLAAGLSTRANTNKLLLDIKGKSLIERTILNMYNICSKIVVVGGHKIEDIWIVLKKYPKVELIYNENYLEGMYSSVKVGLKQTSGDRIFIIPGDYPSVRPSTFMAMTKYKDDIVIPKYQNKNGHPLLINKNLKDEIMFSKEYNSLRDFIYTKERKYVDIHDPWILKDIDTMKDYHDLLGNKNNILAK